MPTRHWLIKSEPDVYSIDDLARDGTTFWDGVRNHEARNAMRDGMKVEDLALFYHSNADPSGVAGIARVSKAAAPDETAFDPKDDHFDPKSRRAEPTWYGVEVAFVEKLPAVVSLHAIKADARLRDMALLKRSRLSVVPVRAAEWRAILAMAKAADR
jgi:predicted RNA-binding protein with PUA-like domain